MQALLVSWFRSPSAHTLGSEPAERLGMSREAWRVGTPAELGGRDAEPRSLSQLGVTTPPPRTVLMWRTKRVVSGDERIVTSTGSRFPDAGDIPHSSALRYRARTMGRSIGPCSPISPQREVVSEITESSVRAAIAWVVAPRAIEFYGRAESFRKARTRLNGTNGIKRH